MGLQFSNGLTLDYSHQIFRVVKAIKEALKTNIKNELIVNHKRVNLSVGELTQILEKLRSLPVGISKFVICRNVLSTSCRYINGGAVSACGCNVAYVDFLTSVQFGCDNHVIYVDDEPKLNKFLNDYIKLNIEENHKSAKNTAFSQKSELLKIFSSSKKDKVLRKMGALLIQKDSVENSRLAKCLKGSSTLTKRKYGNSKTFEKKIKNCLKTLRKKWKPLGYTVKFKKDYSSLSPVKR